MKKLLHKAGVRRCISGAYPTHQIINLKCVQATYALLTRASTKLYAHLRTTGIRGSNWLRPKSSFLKSLGEKKKQRGGRSRIKREVTSAHASRSQHEKDIGGNDRKARTSIRTTMFGRRTSPRRRGNSSKRGSWRRLRRSRRPCRCRALAHLMPPLHLS